MWFYCEFLSFPCDRKTLASKTMQLAENWCIIFFLRVHQWSCWKPETQRQWFSRYTYISIGHIYSNICIYFWIDASKSSVAGYRCCLDVWIIIAMWYCENATENTLCPQFKWRKMLTAWMWCHTAGGRGVVSPLEKQKSIHSCFSKVLVLKGRYEDFIMSASCRRFTHPHTHLWWNGRLWSVCLQCVSLSLFGGHEY